MRIRVFENVKVKRSLPYGSATLTFKPGDYEVGTEIPSDAVPTLLASKKAKRIPLKGERETKQRKKRSSKAVA